jgi:hypothetical protein
MSHDGHPLLMCDVTDPTPTARHTENTTYSTIAGVYRVYRAVAWQRVDQIRHIAPSLRLLFPSSLTVCHRPF